MIELESHKIKRSAFPLSGFPFDIIESEHLMIVFHEQMKMFIQIDLDRLLHPVQFLFVSPENHHVIHIPDIMCRV